MKEILISIKPEWVAKILNGKKTIEIRKTMPKCELPAKVYIYCTNGGSAKLYKNANAEEWFLDRNGWRGGTYGDRYLSGKVVAEFILKWCDKRSIAGLTHSPSDFNAFLKRAGINLYKNSKEFYDYVGKKDYIYAWHITDLKIYDKPRELSEFKVLNKDVAYVGAFGWMFNEKELSKYIPLKRAPQSWQYIKGVKK